MLKITLHNKINYLQASKMAYKNYYVNMERSGGGDGSYIRGKWSVAFGRPVA
jgi:hypothetical protein